MRIDPGDIRKKGKVPTSGSLFFCIFQIFMSGTASRRRIWRVSARLLRLHRHRRTPSRGANDESNWRGILECFAPAVLLGLTSIDLVDAALRSLTAHCLAAGTPHIDYGEPDTGWIVVPRSLEALLG